MRKMSLNSLSRIDDKIEDDFQMDLNNEDELFETGEKIMKKKSVIILTPPILPMASPKFPS